jgi:hypothetical protein
LKEAIDVDPDSLQPSQCRVFDLMIDHEDFLSGPRAPERKGKHVTVERLIEEASQKQSLAATRWSPRKQVPEVHARRLKKGRRTTISLIAAAIAAPFLREPRRILMSTGE